MGLRNRVTIAFGGGVGLEDIDELKRLDIDVLDIGRQIVDAPLLDMRLEIESIETRIGSRSTENWRIGRSAGDLNGISSP